MSKRAAAIIGFLSLLSACGTDRDTGSGTAAPGEGDAAGALLGTTWEWASTTTPVERSESTDSARYTLRLHPEGRAEFKFDCNSGSASYELIDNRLTFGPMISTRMACPADSQDAIFMRQLGQVTTYFMQDSELFLEMPYDSGTMRFRAAAEPDA